MQYREMGKTGEKVSVLGFGRMRLPVINGNPAHIDEEKAIGLIRTAIDKGVNYIDTAYPYHSENFSLPGNSEPFVGKILKDGYREKVFIATKLPVWLADSREDMDKLLDEQLKRLDTDYIDFYLLHGLGKNSWKSLKEKEVEKFLDSALKSGKVKYAGFSFHDDLETFKEIVDYYDWSFCQIQLNFMDVNFQAGLAGLKYAADKGMGLVIMEPLRGGSLAVNTPEVIMKKYNEIVPGRSSVDWALRWVMNHTEVSVVLSGMNEMEQVIENINTAETALGNSMTEKEMEAIAFAEKTYRKMIKVPCTGCGYCMPCPQGVAIPANFKFYNDYHMFKDPNEKRNYNIWINGKSRADSCIKCGQCEEKCPQQIKIADELVNVMKLFKE